MSPTSVCVATRRHVSRHKELGDKVGKYKQPVSRQHPFTYLFFCVYILTRVAATSCKQYGRKVAVDAFYAYYFIKCL